MVGQVFPQVSAQLFSKLDVLRRSIVLAIFIENYNNLIPVLFQCYYVV